MRLWAIAGCLFLATGCGFLRSGQVWTGTFTFDEDNDAIDTSETKVRATQEDDGSLTIEASADEHTATIWIADPTQDSYDLGESGYWVDYPTGGALGLGLWYFSWNATVIEGESTFVDGIATFKSGDESEATVLSWQLDGPKWKPEDPATGGGGALAMSCADSGICIYYTFSDAADYDSFVSQCGSTYLGDGNQCDTSWASCEHSDAATGRTSTTYVDGYSQSELSGICAQFQP